MGSISNDIFCKILRASDKVYATEAVYTKKLVLEEGDKQYNFNTKYYNSVLDSSVHLTQPTAYLLGNAMTLAGGDLTGIPRQYQFLYDFPGGNPLTAGGTIQLWLDDQRPLGGFVDSGFSPHAQTIYITNGSASKWFEIKVSITVPSSTQANITFTNTGAADYTGNILFCLEQTPVRQTT